tara:strand:+ start:100 stop:3195 length:3096 start_codon:yes stop_codon:yes gene_type:complete
MKEKRFTNKKRNNYTKRYIYRKTKKKMMGGSSSYKILPFSPPAGPSAVVGSVAPPAAGPPAAVAPPAGPPAVVGSVATASPAVAPAGPPALTQIDLEYKQLCLHNKYSSLWWDTMHDRINFISPYASIDEDDLMINQQRRFPDDISTEANGKNFMDHFKDRYSYVPRSVAINRISCEFCIKDIFSGFFFGFALNEFIDQADTSTLNYLKYYEDKTGITLKVNNPKGLVRNDDTKPPHFSNSFLYNCDILLYKHFFDLQHPSHNDPIDDWSTTNCEDRHLFTLNAFWKYLLTEIVTEFNSATSNDFEKSFDHAIEALRNIDFTDFEMIKKTRKPRDEDYKSYLYKYPIFTIDGETYPYITTQSFCATNIPIPGKNVKARAEGKTTYEQKRCFDGLKIVIDTYLAKHRLNKSDAGKVISYFYMLLKFAGDSSHIVLYNILKQIIGNYQTHGTPTNSENLAIYLSERPLLVRSFSQDMVIYCKHLSRFDDYSIPHSPDDVICVKLEDPGVKQGRLIKKYNDDLAKLVDYPDADLNPSDDPGTAIETINLYHPIIKIILACEDLITKKDRFIKCLKVINQKMIPSSLFQSRRISCLSKLSSYLSSLIDKSIDKKYTDLFNEGIEYLKMIKLINDNQESPDDIKAILEIKKKSFKDLYKPLYRGFQHLQPLRGQRLSQYLNDRSNTTDLVAWFEDGYQTTKDKVTASVSRGIDRTLEYLMLYDYFMEHVEKWMEEPMQGGANQSTNPYELLKVSNDNNNSSNDNNNYSNDNNNYSNDNNNSSISSNNMNTHLDSDEIDDLIEAIETNDYKFAFEELTNILENPIIIIIIKEIDSKIKKINKHIFKLDLDLQTKVIDQINFGEIYHQFKGVSDDFNILYELIESLNRDLNQTSVSAPAIHYGFIGYIKEHIDIKENFLDMFKKLIQIYKRLFEDKANWSDFSLPIIEILQQKISNLYNMLPRRSVKRKLSNGSEHERGSKDPVYVYEYVSNNELLAGGSNKKKKQKKTFKKKKQRVKRKDKNKIRKTRKKRKSKKST